MRNLWIFLFIAFSFSLLAQNRLDKPEMYFGANFGQAGSMIGFKPTIDQGFLLGYTGGLVFRYVGDKYMGVQAELNFSQRGWNELSGLYSRRLNYIELPFLTHMYLGKKNRVFFNVGPKVSYLLSEKVLVNGTANTEAQHTTLLQNPFDYGLCAGLGFLFNIKGNVFQLEARGYYALSDVFSNDKREYFSTSNNINASVNLAWLIQVK